MHVWRPCVEPSRRHALKPSRDAFASPHVFPRSPLLETASLVLIVSLAIVAFCSILSHFFIADDFFLILRGKESVFLSLAEASQTLYRPMGDFLMAIDYRLFDLNPEYYYLQNILVHVVNAYLVLLIARRILRDRLASLCCALFFVTFSAASEAVFWIAANSTEGIYTLFLLSSLLLFCRFLETRSRRYFVASLVLCVASFLSKESAISLVFLVFLTGRFLRVPLRKAIGYSLPYAVIGIGFLGTRVQPWLNGPFAQGLYTIGPHVLVNLISYSAALASFGALTMLARLQGSYQSVLGITQSLMPYVTILAIGSVLLFLIVLRSANRAVRYGALWTLATLLPYVSLVFLQIRYMYAATVGFALLLSALLVSSNGSRGMRSERLPVSLKGTMIVVIIAFGILSNNVASAYYANVGNAYRNILNDIRPPGDAFPEDSVLIFLDLPHLTSGQTLPHLAYAIQLFYGQSLTVVSVDSREVCEVLARYESRTILVFQFDQSTLHVRPVNPCTQE